MKPIALSAVAILSFAACNQPAMIQNPTIPVSYPATQTVEQTDDYFGTAISDPYRWLEDDNAADTKTWVKAQNETTFGYLDQIPYRAAIKDRYRELFNYPKYSSPFRAGEYYFFYKNDGLQNQSVIYVQKGLDGEPSVFLDPNLMSEKGTTSASIAGISDDNRYAAYMRQDAGSDWRTIRVMEIATKKELDDKIEWVKFSSVSWYKDGFFYSRYPQPKAGAELSGKNVNHSVYYHKVGTPQSADQLVYADPAHPEMNHYTQVTEDERYLIIYASPGTDGYATIYKDLAANGKFITLFPGAANKSSVVHNIGSTFLVHTDIDAPKYRLIAVDVNRPEAANWKTIIPEKENLLSGVSAGGKKLFADYLEKACTRIYQYNYDGSGETPINLPGLGSAGGFGGREEDNQLFYSFTSFTNPGTIYQYDVATGKSVEFRKTELKFNPADYEERQVFYKSKDGTEVSMFVVHKKGLPLDGTNPTYLYGYGGFNISLTPSFSASRMILLENGGVFAMPNLRGGGEYGEAWHKDGMLDKKQHVFDDFIAAAEYLIAEGYTSKEKLAIAGGSNGGLLVGACMTQRPDLFAVAFPAVGVLDMLRYHLFTIGRAWAPEYGTSTDSKASFDNLMSYSPLHNLKAGTTYPATMITTADHDDRVVPAHSFKFAAALQQAHTGDVPVLIRIETDAGHGAGKSTDQIIEEQGDIWSFFFYNTNAPVKYLKQ